MVKYQNFWSSILCAVARVSTVLPAVGGAYYDTKSFYCIVWVFGQLKGKWEGCQGVSIAAVLRQT